MQTECSCQGALFKSIPQQVSSPSLLLQATSVHFRPNRTNLESWAFLGWGYIWAWPSPGRSWPRCCHWGSGCACWRCQGSSSLSSVNNWCGRPGEASPRSCVCLQSSLPSHHPHHPRPPVLLSPSCSKHRGWICLLGFSPKKEVTDEAEQSEDTALWAVSTPGWCRALTTRTTQKEIHSRSLGKETLFFQNMLKWTQNISASSAEALWFSRCFILREHLLDTESTRDAAKWGRLFIFQNERGTYRFQLL